MANPTVRICPTKQDAVSSPVKLDECVYLNVHIVSCTFPPPPPSCNCFHCYKCQHNACAVRRCSVCLVSWVFFVATEEKKNPRFFFRSRSPLIPSTSGSSMQSEHLLESRVQACYSWVLPTFLTALRSAFFRCTLRFVCYTSLKSHALSCPLLAEAVLFSLSFFPSTQP